MPKCFLAVLILILTAIIPGNSSWADDSIYQGNGYQVFPTKSSDVQLFAETITITDNKAFGRSKRDNFSFDVDMTFKNHGGDVLIQMGFPVLIDESDGEQTEIDTHFRTWVSGQEVQIIKKEGVPNPGIKDSHFSKLVYTYTVAFKSGEVKRIKHSYDIGGISNSMGGWSLRYVLRTGGLWKGVIEDYSMRYITKIAKANEIIGALPRESKAEIDDGSLILSWNIKDYKPKNDFILIGGSARHPLISRSLSTDKAAIKEYHGIMPSAELRYAKNKVFAEYGYPFKNPLVRAQFYYSGSRYKESPTFLEQKISKEHQDYIKWLSAFEEEQMKPGGFDDKITSGALPYY
jgi:hypothetical protein